MKTLLILILMTPALALATGKPSPTNDPAATATADASAAALSGSVSHSASRSGDSSANAAGGSVEGVSASGGSAEATGGSIGENAVNAGSEVRTENNSSFFAFGTTFPNSQGCFAGIQGGGGGNGGAGFLGFHFLDTDCWSNFMSNQQLHAETKARLDCYGKHFRGAIAFDQPGGRKEKYRYCVNYMTDVYTRQITEAQQYVDDALASGLLQIREDLVTERDAVCDEKVKRCEAAVAK